MRTATLLHDTRTTADGITYNVITTPEQLADVLATYSLEDEFTYDVETLGPHRGDTVRNTVAWLSLAIDDRTDVIPMGHPNGDLLRVEYPLLASAAKRMAKGLEIRPQDHSRAVNKAVKVLGHHLS